jgi:phosphate acetyltransferase
MSFRSRLLERAAGGRARIVLCEGGDPRVEAAAEQLRSKHVVDPIVLGGRGLDPTKDPRLGRIAQLLRERRPERVRDGVHALDIAADPLLFGAALVALGEAEGCVAGAACPTGDVVRAALWAIGTAPGVGRVCSCCDMVVPVDSVLTYTDCAVVP